MPADDTGSTRRVRSALASAVPADGSPRRLPRAPTGLRWRLAGWVALVVLLSSGITFLAVYHGTGSQLRHQIDEEITGDTGELAQALKTSGARSPAAVAAAAERYIRAQPFSASSTLLFALVPGTRPSTNQPELFGSQSPDEDETAAEQDQENRMARRLLTVGDGFSTVDLPDIGDLRLLKQSIRIPGSRSGARIARGLGGESVTVGVGEPLASVAHAQRGVARAFILAGILALAGALLASLLIGTRFSRPLRRMAAVAAQVDAGDLHPRIHDVARDGEEVRVLADAFNHMLDRLTDAFAGQRAFVADASHELRTPLTVIRGQLEVLAAQEHPEAHEVRRVERLVQAEVARITRLVDDLLLLAKSEQTQFLRREPIALQRFVAELWDGISLLGVDRRFELGGVPAGTLDADPDRLAQALRNLIGNAIEHTTRENLIGSAIKHATPENPAGNAIEHATPEKQGLVRLDVEPGAAGQVRFVVQDNGPGIPPDQRERVFDRFHRTDAARDRASGGTGLGLAIVRAIAEAHGGHVRALASTWGGARIELELPHFAAAAKIAAMHPPSFESVPSRVPGR
jgi:two-component system OmpR family sensor kinase